MVNTHIKYSCRSWGLIERTAEPPMTIVKTFSLCALGFIAGRIRAHCDSVAKLGFLKLVSKLANWPT